MELELAKVEVKGQVAHVTKAGALFTGTGVAALLALQVLSVAAALALAEVMPTAVGFAIVGVAYLIVAAVLYAVGRKRLRMVQAPTRALRSVNEDVRAATSALSRGMHRASTATAAGGTDGL